MKTKFIFLFFLLALNSSCTEDPVEFNVERVIVNNSTVPVIWKIYENGEITESISITSGGEDRKKELCRSEVEPKRFSCDILSGEDIRLIGKDSVVVEYNGTKKEVYCIDSAPCDDNGKNIFLIILRIIENEDLVGFVRTIDDDKKTRVYTFTITEEDYKNAEPIGD